MIRICKNNFNLHNHLTINHNQPRFLFFPEKIVISWILLKIILPVTITSTTFLPLSFVGEIPVDLRTKLLQPFPRLVVATYPSNLWHCNTWNIFCSFILTLSYVIQFSELFQNQLYFIYQINGLLTTLW